MKRFLLLILSSFVLVNIASAKNSIGIIDDADMALSRDLHILKKGEAFSYPLPENSMIECYAEKYDGSIDAFTQYNDYFLFKNGELYSQTMHKLYKPEKSNEYKKVDRARILKNGITLKLYDSLWEPSLRRHYRNIEINTKTGEYYMEAFQDNAMWYREAKAKGYCRVIQP